jgi:hypothetical protein
VSPQALASVAGDDFLVKRLERATSHRKSNSFAKVEAVGGLLIHPASPPARTPPKHHGRTTADPFAAQVELWEPA